MRKNTVSLIKQQGRFVTKNRDELIRDVEVKYPQKKAVAAEIEVSVDDEEFDEFPMRKAKIKT